MAWIARTVKLRFKPMPRISIFKDNIDSSDYKEGRMNSFSQRLMTLNAHFALFC